MQFGCPVIEAKLYDILDTDVIINYSLLSPKGVSYGCEWGYTPKLEDALIWCVSSLKEARYGPLTHS